MFKININFSITQLHFPIAACVMFLCCSTSLFAQMSEQERQVLLDFAEKQNQAYDSMRLATDLQAQVAGIPQVLTDTDGQEIAWLKRFNADGTPEYTYLRNATAQQTISVDEVKTGGSAGYNLSGAGERLGIWDGNVRTAHQEFGGRATTGDGGGTLSAHGTHVAGTIAAGGANAAAQGMSHAVTLRCYNTGNDIAEMAAEAAAATPISASNHSYGPDYGWVWNSNAGMWSWWGGASNVEDWRHGAYLTEAINYDQTARNAPFYTIVVAAGNENGSGTNGTHQHNGSGSFNDSHNFDGNNVNLDCLPNDATAKNVITVGNVQAIPGGYSNPGQVVLAGSSSRGPTDDGRIKPDLCAQGVGVFSCEQQSNTDYGTQGGTSMAAPAVTGSIGLLAQHWRNLNLPTSVLRSATYKALLIHTADEAGPNPGPDYQFGWGLVNVRRAAQLMEADALLGCIHIVQSSINTGGTYTFTIESNGLEPIMATVAWTDLPGTATSNGVIDETTLRLVNDLDMRITRGGSTWFPYTLNPANPNAAASTGDNNRDNVEKILIANPTAGTYTLTITPSGSITSGPQPFSLIISGNGPVAVNQNITFGTFNDERTYVASNNVNVSGNVSVVSGGDLKLYGGNYVNFGPNFTMSGTAELEARIVNDPCGDGQSAAPGDDEHVHEHPEFPADARKEKAANSEQIDRDKPPK